MCCGTNLIKKKTDYRPEDNICNLFPAKQLYSEYIKKSKNWTLTTTEKSTLKMDKPKGDISLKTISRRHQTHE